MSQTKHGNDMLHKFGIDPVKLCLTPINSSTRIDKDEYSISFDKKRYRDIIGSFLYLIASGLNITF